jgi:putative two-component system response regulator
LRILIVDDNEVNRILPRALLERLGAHVGEAADGEAGLALLAREGFDAVLLDISMPGLSGTEVCRRLRADPATRALRVVAYTAHSDEASATEIRDAGFDDLLVKPIRRDTLARAFGLVAP